MSDQTMPCASCPSSACPGCPNQPPKVGMRNGNPPPVAVRRVRKERPPLDRSKMGFGNHSWEYIDPKEVPTDFGPPDGVPRRDFNAAFNRPHPETDVDIDIISRPGAVISTTAVGFEGEWTVVRLPKYHEGKVLAFLRRDANSPVTEVSMDALGVVAERFTNLYDEQVITKRISGGKANRASREALTKKGDGVYT